jgi:lipoate-protein ligase A
LAGAKSQGFKAILKIQLHEDALTSDEAESAENLKEKYASEKWTFEGKV